MAWVAWLALSGLLRAQELNFTAVRAEVDFSQHLQPWDGFGFNYVETAQTRNYDRTPQDYGGFSLLREEDCQKILHMVFGDDGLKVTILKMFLDPWHQREPGGPYDHETTTRWMRYFAREGLKIARASGRQLVVLTTLYGPPAYVTRQKMIRGRDLDPQHKQDLVRYLVDWVKFLREREGLPVRYVSLHNEGEDWKRWTRDGTTDFEGHDYNLFWSPEQVVEFVKLVASALREAGCTDVSVTPGEATNWYRFSIWGYADALANDPVALSEMGLITCHGFYTGTFGRWFAPHTSRGIDLIRSRRPELRAWVTSTSWGQMDARSIQEHHGNIYCAKVNAIIPWAGIQRPAQWVRGDPNPGSAFLVREDGSWEVRRGYWMYRQVSRVGQPGMAVARATAMDSELAPIAFASDRTSHPDAFVLVNIGSQRLVRVAIRGCRATSFRAFRTTDDERDLGKEIGRFVATDGAILYEAPACSVTTFTAEP